MKTSITLAGNLTGDPQLAYVGDGIARATFTVAVTERKKGASGQWEDAGTAFYRCTAWRHLAEQVTEAFRKGNSVLVAGTLRVESFERKDGSNGTSLEVTVDEAGLTAYTVTKTGRATGTPDPWATTPQTAATAPQTVPGRQPYQPAPNAAQSGHSGPENGTWGQPTLTDTPPF